MACHFQPIPKWETREGDFQRRMTGGVEAHRDLTRLLTPKGVAELASKMMDVFFRFLSKIELAGFEIG